MKADTYAPSGAAIEAFNREACGWDFGDGYAGYVPEHVLLHCLQAAYAVDFPGRAPVAPQTETQPSA